MLLQFCECYFCKRVGKMGNVTGTMVTRTTSIDMAVMNRKISDKFQQLITLQHQELDLKTIGKDIIEACMAYLIQANPCLCIPAFVNPRDRTMVSFHLAGDPGGKTWKEVMVVTTGEGTIMFLAFRVPVIRMLPTLACCLGGMWFTVATELISPFQTVTQHRYTSRHDSLWLLLSVRRLCDNKIYWKF